MGRNINKVSRMYVEQAIQKQKQQSSLARTRMGDRAKQAEQCQSEAVVSSQV
jgi:hypothetical protein